MYDFTQTLPKVPTMVKFSNLLLLVATAEASSTQRRQLRNTMPYLTPSDIQALVPNVHYDPETTKDKWVSMSEDVEFLPLIDTGNEKLKNAERALRDQYYYDSSGATLNNHTHGAYAQDNPYSVQPFIEGIGGYDQYQQAWRMLGFVIDCNQVIYDDDFVQEGGHSRDNNVVSQNGCARYVLWAAYVDTSYEGGGIGEYQYWDREKGEWNDSACYVGRRKLEGDNGGNYKSRCAKMDCHSEDTHFSVLGFFKHRSHDDWMEQLFKHEGVCLWTDDEYSFMKEARRAWPRGCTDTGEVLSNGNSLYYDIKPLRGGKITLALYTDTECIDEYSSNANTVESILGNLFNNAGDDHERDNPEGEEKENDYSGESLSESLSRWNSAFDLWHYCHPCVAHDVENTDGSKYAQYMGYDDAYYVDDYSDDYYNRRKLGWESKPKGNIFECYDDAGYTNVNQCMKFSAKTVMKTATFRDLSLGRHQGTLVEYPLSGYVTTSTSSYSKYKWASAGTCFFFIGASAALAYSVFNLRKISLRTNVGDDSNTASLL